MKGSKLRRDNKFHFNQKSYLFATADFNLKSFGFGVNGSVAWLMVFSHSEYHWNVFWVLTFNFLEDRFRIHRHLIRILCPRHIRTNKICAKLRESVPHFAVSVEWKRSPSNSIRHCTIVVSVLNWLNTYTVVKSYLSVRANSDVRTKVYGLSVFSF